MNTYSPVISETDEYKYDSFDLFQPDFLIENNVIPFGSHHGYDDDGYDKPTDFTLTQCDTTVLNSVPEVVTSTRTKQIERLPLPQDDHNNFITTTCNMVYTYPIDVILNLPAITKKLRCEAIQDNLKQFPGLVYRVCSDKKVAGLIFERSLVCTGAKSTSQAMFVINCMLHKLELIGYKVNLVGDPVCHNVVVSGYLFNQAINLTKVNENFPLYSQYDDAIFPGLIHKDPRLICNLTVIMYGIGKLVGVGGKSEATTHSAIKQVYELLDRTPGCLIRELKKDTANLSRVKAINTRKRPAAEINSLIESANRKRK